MTLKKLSYLHEATKSVLKMNMFKYKKWPTWKKGDPRGKGNNNVEWHFQKMWYMEDTWLKNVTKYMMKICSAHSTIIFSNESLSFALVEKFCEFFFFSKQKF